MRVKDVIKATEGKLVWGKVNDYFEGTSIDTRTIRPGQLFIPLKGKRFNGHQFIPQALSKGAGGVLYSDIHEYSRIFSRIYTNLKNNLTNQKFVIQVEDTLEALGQLANFYREKYNPKVIAVTGSVGKTTTKNLLAKILSYEFNTFKNLGTQNNLIGVPINILKISPSCEILILELGTNQPGEISKLSQICQPDIGIVLNIGPSHLEYLKSLEGIKEEKLSLFNYIRPGGYIVINSDFLTRQEVSSVKKQEVITIGIKTDADFKAREIEFLNGGINFKVNRIKFFAPFINIKYIYNILPCIAVASIFGVDTGKIRKAISEFKSCSRRFQKIKLKDVMIVDDTYNSNPLSMECALEGIAKLDGYGRKIIVCGDMLELGKYSAQYHLRIGRLIANSNIDLLYLLGSFSKYVRRGALYEGMNPNNIRIFPTLDQVCQEILFSLRKEDLILVKGSRATGMDRIVEELKEKVS